MDSSSLPDPNSAFICKENCSLYSSMALFMLHDKAACELVSWPFISSFATQTVAEIEHSTCTLLETVPSGPIMAPHFSPPFPIR